MADKRNRGCGPPVYRSHINAVRLLHQSSYGNPGTRIHMQRDSGPTTGGQECSAVTERATAQHVRCSCQPQSLILPIKLLTMEVYRRLPWWFVSTRTCSFTKGLRAGLCPPSEVNTRNATWTTWKVLACVRLLRQMSIEVLQCRGYYHTQFSIWWVCNFSDSDIGSLLTSMTLKRSSIPARTTVIASSVAGVQRSR